MTNATATTQELKPGTVRATEEAAFEFYLEAQAQAFKGEGMLGVMQLGLYAAKECDQIAAECESQGQPSSMTTAVIAGHLLTTWIPNMLAGMREHTENEAKAAAKAAKKKK